MARWGRFVYRRRKLLLVTALLLGAISVVPLVQGGQLKDSNDLNFESAQGAAVLSNSFPSGASITLVMGDSSAKANDPGFRAAVLAAVAPLLSDDRVARVVTPYQQNSSNGAVNPLLVSSDGHHVEVDVLLKKSFEPAQADYPSVRGEVRSPTLTISATGILAMQMAFTSYSESDLQRSEKISLPVAAILLLLVFASGVAALLCLGVGVLAILSGVSAVFLLSHATSVSTYAINIVSLVGLGVAIDYSLFIVSRFREELAKTDDVAAALETTMATAGRAILFSGLTVAVGLGGLLVYRGTFLVSLGFSAALVVAAAVLFSLTFLPAMLAILGPGINRLRLPLPRSRNPGHWWASWAAAVMRHPVRFLAPTLALLLLLGAPFLHLQILRSDVKQLPANAEARVGDQLLNQDFAAHGSSTFDVVMQFTRGSANDASNIAIATQLQKHLAALGSVQGVHSSTAGNVANLTVVSSLDPQSQAARDLVATLRSNDSVSGAATYVTGLPPYDVDFESYMAAHTPAAIAVVVAASLLLLLLLLRSVVLPIKAVLMNLLSISASFGALVWVIQDGHLSGLLNFERAPIDPTLPAIMFCLIFGLSMDYEVFLLTRMQEGFRAHHDNRRAVAEGLQSSGRLITGAAAIMVAVFLAFAVGSQEVVIKAVGIGIGVAVLVDATLVRAIVVPALMRLLGDINWWAPRWLRSKH